MNVEVYVWYLARISESYSGLHFAQQQIYFDCLSAMLKLATNQYIST